MFSCILIKHSYFILDTLYSNTLTHIKHKLELVHENMFVKKHVSM